MHKHRHDQKQHTNQQARRTLLARQVKPRRNDRYDNAIHGFRNNDPFDDEGNPRPPVLDLGCDLIGQIHQNHLGAFRCARGLIQYAREVGNKLVKVQAQLGKKTFVEWTRPTLGIPPEEALSWIAFAQEPEARNAVVSYDVPVEPEVLQSLLGLLHGAFL